MKQKKKWFDLLLSLFLMMNICLQVSCTPVYADENSPFVIDETTAENVPQEAAETEKSTEKETAEEITEEGKETAGAQTEDETQPSGEEETVPQEQPTAENQTRGSPRAAAAPAAAPKNVETAVTSLTIQNLQGKDVDRMYFSDRFYLAMTWNASSHGADLHEGDYFDMTLPDQMVFPSDSDATDFNIYGSDGTTVIARAHVTPGPGNKGGTVRVTFNNWVEGKENVQGRIRLVAQFDREQIKIGQDNKFQISVDGKVVDVTTNVFGPKEIDSEVLMKYGYSSSDKNYAEWNVRINHQKQALNNAVLSDHLSDGNGTETYDPDSFRLIRVEYDSYGHMTKEFETVDLTGKLTVAPDRRSFTLNLGNLGGQQYRLRYRTTYTPGTTLRNNATLESTERSETRSASYVAAQSGGDGSGDQASRIRLVKVDGDNSEITLSGAVFRVTKPDGGTFELTTGEDGTITSGPLASGTYKVKEIKAPAGYELKEEEHTLQVTSGKAAVLTVENDPVLTNRSVVKNWIGPAAGPVTVRLYADGQDTQKTLTLSAETKWSGEFRNLRKYTPEGSEINYTLQEDVPAGYTSRVNYGEGKITVDNINTQTVSIPVTKKWVGKEGESATVKLLADGQEKDTVTLNAAGGWTHTFSDLPKYDQTDGHEIVYTLEEQKMDGYTTVISGTAQTGFTVTNTITGKISIPVTKKWVGKEGESAKIRLYADGKQIDSVTLNKTNSWQHTFEGLEQYKDGKEITYTIKEDELSGYTARIEGNQKNGYVVTNTENPKKPDKPKTPQNPSGSKTTPPGTSGKTPTGAASNFWLYTVLLGASAAGLFFLKRRKG